MTLKEYERMMKIYTFVYSTKPRSPERDARIAELSDKDLSALYDFDMGLMSGRIKRPEEQNKESEDSRININNGKSKEIKNFEDFKKALVRTGTYQSLLELKKNSPDRYKMYQERLEREKAR